MSNLKGANKTSSYMIHHTHVFCVQPLPPVAFCHQPAANFNIRFAHSSLSKVGSVQYALLFAPSPAALYWRASRLSEEWPLFTAYSRCGSVESAGEIHDHDYRVDARWAALHHRLAERRVHDVGWHQLHI